MLDIIAWLGILFGLIPLLIAIATVLMVVYHLFLKPKDDEKKD